MNKSFGVGTRDMDGWPRPDMQMSTSISCQGTVTLLYVVRNSPGTANTLELERLEIQPGVGDGRRI